VERNNIYNDLSIIEAQSKQFFAGGKFDWERSKASVWSDLDSFVLSHPIKRVRFDFRVIQWAAAAIILLLIGISGFMRFYSKTVETPAGQHFVLNLPDGSMINLNAQSSITYNPYWWLFERKMTFEGEAFFEVVKGNRFSVISKLGTTQVMGTSFNIYARDEIYKVTCITGSVKVMSKTSSAVTLKPNCKAVVNPDGKIEMTQNIETLPEISWKEYSFLFTAVPVKQVFSEIERQYGITINSQIDGYTLYSGNFSKNQKVEEILGYICPAMGFKYIKKSEKTYSIIPDER